MRSSPKTSRRPTSWRICFGGSAAAACRERLILQPQAAALQHCLDALPTGQRQSPTLSFYYGLSYEQVAQQMGRPLGTVKSWVRRSLVSLKESLEAAQWPSSQ